MEGLYKAAAAVQSSESARRHERLLDQPGHTPVEVLQQLKQAAKVICNTGQNCVSVSCMIWLAQHPTQGNGLPQLLV